MAAVNVNVKMVVDYKTAEQEPLFTAAHSLLQLLHERDCRRPFTPPNHWLIKYVFSSECVSSTTRSTENRTVNIGHIL